MKLTDRVIQHLFLDMFDKAIETGTLTIITPEKNHHVFAGKNAGSTAEWIIHDWKIVGALSSRGDIGLGETYAEGLWDTDDLEALFRVFIDNLDALDSLANGSGLSKFWFTLVNHVFRRNSVSGSRQNIGAHYDVGNEFYKLWLDKTMTYSSAIYTGEDQTLEAAQFQKYGRILKHITPDRKNILEIGCGWGGFAEQAAEFNHDVTAITVSRQQHDFATNRLKNRASVMLKDYRHVREKFDAIASIEMFEAVGMRYWPNYFSTIKDSLAPDGVAMVQAITVKDELFDAYVKRSDYIRHYVFPGGLLPSLERFKQSAERAGLACRDVYSFGHDYVKTLRVWLASFNANENAIRALGYNNEFIRSWRLYMSMCAASFACQRTNVMQVELVHA